MPAEAGIARIIGIHNNIVILRKRGSSELSLPGFLFAWGNVIYCWHDNSQTNLVEPLPLKLHRHSASLKMLPFARRAYHDGLFH